jgi:ribosomal protein S18 acetylase RimI-like enzyme
LDGRIPDRALLVLLAPLFRIESEMTGLPDGYRLRAARVEDAALVRDVTLRCWTGTVAENSSAYRETVEEIAGQLGMGGAVVLLRGEEAVGAGRFHPVPGPVGDAREWVEIKRVGVAKALRKLGLGAPLVAAIEDAARARGYAGAQLGVRHDQPRLLRFWEGLGYRLADDVLLHTVNPLTPTPTFMRKWFN